MKVSLLPSYPLFIPMNPTGGYSIQLDSVRHLTIITTTTRVTAYDTNFNVVWVKRIVGAQLAFNSHNNVIVRSMKSLCVYQDSTLLVTIAGPIPITSYNRGKIAVDDENKIYWADEKNHQVLVYSEELVLIRAFRVVRKPNPICWWNNSMSVFSLWTVCSS